MIPISSPTKISIITRLRGINSKNFKEKNNYIPPENYKYTMFSPNDTSPSDILYISELPLEPSKINEIKNLNIQNYNLNFLNFDKVYPESFSLDLIYQQILQNPLNDLFYKKNSCMLFFGPSMGGKSYLLRGSHLKNENESGLLTRAINDIFQRLKFNNNICLKISVYQIFLDKIYDLLSNEDNKEVNIETNYSEINHVYNINILGLTKKEIKDNNEYDFCLREAINNRRYLAQFFGINDIKQKSHFIISLFLENKNENNDEYIPFSQFDFVELVSSNFGLLNENENENDINIEPNLFQNTNDVFNSIAENIICISHNSLSSNDTLLTLALKNTLTPCSNIIFMNCVIPWEYPLKDSYSSLKFTNMIFSQIYKNENNSPILDNIKNNNNNQNNLTYLLDYSDNNNNIYNNNAYQNIHNKNIINNSNNSGYEKMNEYLNSLTIDSMDYLFPEKDFSNNNDIKHVKNYKNEINNLYTKYNKKNNNSRIIKPYKEKNKNNNIVNKTFDNKKNNSKKITKNKLNNGKISKNNNKSFDNRNITPKERKLKKLNDTLKELEAKSNELNQNSLESKNLYTFNNADKNSINLNNTYNNKTINNEENNNIIPEKNSNTSLQYEKIKEEYSQLKSDNIILKEDINRLEHANKTLELALTDQRNRNIELLNQNEELSNRLLKLEELLDEANIRDEKYKINEINIEKLLNEKLFLNSKINENEKNYNKMKEEKEKYEIEYKVLNTKFNELKNNYDLIYNDYNNIKLNYEEQFHTIENKIDNLLKEIEKLQSENNILRNENEKQRMDINNISIQRDNYKEQYNEQKNKNDLLCVKINEIENEFNDMKKEKMNEEYYRLKFEEYKKNKNENKMKIVNELQNRIQKYREQRYKRELEMDDN